MIKSDENTDPPAERKGAKSFKCWNREPNTLAVRFGASDGEVFAFPYQNWIFNRLRSLGEGDCLTVRFSSHEVTIRGRQLLTVLKSFQDFSVEWVGVVVSRHAGLVPDGSVMVTEITVRSLEEEDD